MKASVELRHEHDAVLFALKVLDKICGMLNSGSEVAYEDIVGILDFLETFIDKCHHSKEEKIYFPALEKAGIMNQGGPIGALLAEHQEVRGYVRLMKDSLAHVPFHRDKFVKASHDYIALVSNHIENENEVLFTAGDSKLSPEEQKTILEKFEEIENMLIGEGKHEEFHKKLEYFRAKYF